MKKFTGEVIYVSTQLIQLRRKYTNIWIHINTENVPEFEIGETVHIKSKHDFPPTMLWNNGQFNAGYTIRIRGRYSLRSSEVEITVEN